MLRIDRITIWIITALFALLTVSMTLVSFIDELTAVSLLALAAVDSVVNRGAYRRYGLLWCVLAIMAFYICYSIGFCNYNTTGAILLDSLLESKPYIVLAVVMAVRPRLNRADRTIFKTIAIINAATATVLLLMPNQVIRMSLGHVAFGGIYIFLSTLMYMCCSVRSDGSFSRRDLIIVIVMACAGLLCTRSKYYGEFVLLIFFLTVYRPGMLRRITLKQVAIIGALAGIIALVAWNKFSYYFIYGGEATTFDPDKIESFARPVLYLTGMMILIDHFPFGTGLASFASAPSANPYSGLYSEYGIDTVWGLSPAKSDFICDAYYPTLSQFGAVGFALFIWLWVYIVRLLGCLVRLAPAKNKRLYSTGILCILFVLIESTAGTAMVNCAGVTAMAILGIIAGQALDARDTLRLQSQSPTDKT